MGPGVRESLNMKCVAYIGLGAVLGLCGQGVGGVVACDPVAATIEPPTEAAGKFGFCMVSRDGVAAIRNEVSNDLEDPQEAIVLVSGQSPAIDQVLLFDVDEEDDFGPSMGQSVALGDGWLAAGSFGNRVMTFAQVGGVWVQANILERPTAAEGDEYFGYTVAGSGSHLAVGDIQPNWYTPGSRVFTYEWVDGTWQHTQVLEDADASFFGACIVVEDDWMLVAVPDAQNAWGDTGTGEVRVYRHDGAAWNTTQTLFPVHFDPAVHDGGFGSHMAISGDVLAVTARDVSGSTPGERPQVYVYRRSGQNWQLLGAVESPTGVDASGFGISVAVAGNLVAVGGWSDETDEGLVHFYDAAGTAAPTLIETIMTDVDADHLYALSMAFMPDGLLVGRPWAGDFFNGLIDVMHLPSGDVELDCDGNGVCDINDLLSGTGIDCDGNGVLDECDIAAGLHVDVDDDGVPDVCEPDCDGDGWPDDHEILVGWALDCNANGVPDSCDIAGGHSPDGNGDGVPDECDLSFVILVASDGSGLFSAVQPALDWAPPGATVTVMPGTYDGPIVFPAHPIRLVSAAGPSETVLAGGSMPAVPVISIVGGVDSTTVLDGFTVAGGGSTSGGLRITGSSPRIWNCTFRDHFNWAAGGGVRVTNGAPLLEECRFINNATDEFGGGASVIDVHDSGEPCRFVNCVFVSNRAMQDEEGSFPHLARGGGLGCRSALFEISGCRFEFNEANYGGGLSGYHTAVGASLLDSSFVFNRGWYATSSGAVQLGHENPTDVGGCYLCGNLNGDIGGNWTDLGGNVFTNECECPDTNGDGVIDANDILLAISQWGPCPGGDCEADVDGDGVVGVNDLLGIINGWGPCEL